LVVQAVIITPELFTAICGPRMAKENKSGNTATTEGEEKDCPLSKEEVYIIESPNHRRGESFRFYLWQYLAFVHFQLQNQAWQLLFFLCMK